MKKIIYLVFIINYVNMGYKKNKCFNIVHNLCVKKYNNSKIVYYYFLLKLKRKNFEKVN